jgi:hypothetical protein
MRELPDRPDLDQLRRQARELQRAATRSDTHALERLHAVATDRAGCASDVGLCRRGAALRRGPSKSGRRRVRCTEVLAVSGPRWARRPWHAVAVASARTGSIVSAVSPVQPR